MLFLGTALLTAGGSAGEAPSSALPGEECRLCDDHGWIGCERCGGDGSYRIVCERCSGRKYLTCPLCGGKGNRPCANCGGVGKIVWKTTKASDPCKFCSRGKISCHYCKKAKKVPCPDCGKTGRSRRACGACSGHGGFPCPLCRLPSPCPACSGGTSMPCFVCLGSGGIKKGCDDCKRYEKRLCERCIGGRIPCEECAATGRLRFVSGNRKAGTQKCSACSGKGWETCDDCDGKGTFPCDHGGSDSESCPQCGLAGMVDCTVCGGRE
jgi:hypothetical protein